MHDRESHSHLDQTRYTFRLGLGTSSDRVVNHTCTLSMLNELTVLCLLVSFATIYFRCFWGSFWVLTVNNYFLNF